MNERPAVVQRTLDVLSSLGAWAIVSENPVVTSCAEAARNRRRLGHIGIPLSDELKTSIGVYEGAQARKFVAIHCRGHQLLDEQKVHQALGAPFQRLGEEELRQAFGSAYGIVNPFLLNRPDVDHLVDHTVLEQYFLPFTMMTNAGDHRWAIEFNAAQVFGAMMNVRVADLVLDRHKHVPAGQTVGILTGNSPESGMLLWQKINERIRRSSNVPFLGDVGFPRVIVDSVPGMGLTMELPQRERHIRPVVLDAVEGLCRSGATLIGIACNTTQFFTSEIRRVCREYGAQFVSIADETADYLRREDIEEFDFLAIGSVSDFEHWSDFGRVFTNFNVHLPDLRDIDGISSLAFSVKQEVITSATINRLRDLINRCTATGTVVLALTELSIVFNAQKRQKSEKRFIDTLDVLAERLAAIVLSEREAVMRER